MYYGYAEGSEPWKMVYSTIARLDSKPRDDGWWFWCQGEASDLISSYTLLICIIFSQLASGNIEGRPTFLINRFHIGTKLAQRLHDLKLRWRFDLHKVATNKLQQPKGICFASFRFPLLLIWEGITVSLTLGMLDVPVTNALKQFLDENVRPNKMQNSMTIYHLYIYISLSSVVGPTVSKLSRSQLKPRPRNCRHGKQPHAKVWGRCCPAHSWVGGISSSHAGRFSLFHSSPIPSELPLPVASSIIHDFPSTKTRQCLFRNSYIRCLHVVSNSWTDSATKGSSSIAFCQFSEGSRQPLLGIRAPPACDDPRSMLHAAQLWGLPP